MTYHQMNIISNNSFKRSIVENSTIDTMKDKYLNIEHLFCLERAPRVINSPWFIGLIVALIVLVMVFAIVCGIMRRKGGNYSGRYISLISLFIHISIYKTNIRNIYRYILFSLPCHCTDVILEKNQNVVHIFLYFFSSVFRVVGLDNKSVLYNYVQKLTDLKFYCFLRHRTGFFFCSFLFYFLSSYSIEISHSTLTDKKYGRYASYTG